VTEHVHQISRHELVEQMRATPKAAGELAPDSLDPETEQTLLTTFRSWWKA
jgi:hypothetical protein